MDDLEVPNDKVLLYWNSDDAFYHPKFVKTLYKMRNIVPITELLDNKKSDSALMKWEDVSK